MTDRDLDRVWLSARPRLNAACDANDRYEPPLWLCASAVVAWVAIGNWLVSLFW